MKVNIGQYIYSALSAITGLTVFPVIADFNTAEPTTPFAVYQRTGCSPEYTKDGFTGDISARQYIHRLATREQYQFTYTIEIYK